jgi:hypothetical protein
MSLLGALYIAVILSLLLTWIAKWLAWPFTRWVLVPLGWVRAACAIARFAKPLAADPAAGAVFVGAWAHRKHRRPADRQFLEGKLAASMPLGGAGIAASGLLAVAQGDVAQARAWLRSLDWVHPKVLPPVCAKVAREWLVAEAASRGAWDEVLTSAKGPTTRATRLLVLVARLMTRGSVVTRGSVPDSTVAPMLRLELWLTWLIAPHRRAFLPLVRQALAPTPPFAPPLVDEPPAGDPETPYRSPAVPGQDLLQIALAAQAAAITAPSAEHLAEAVVAWERALPGLPAPIAEAARVDLAAVAAAARLPIPEGTGFADELRREVRRDVLEELETVSAALESRVSAGRVHDAFAEWTTFLELRRMYDEAGSLAGREAQRLVYARVHDALCPLAVILWNQRKEHPLANAIFRWLLDEAKLTEHATLVPHEEKNAGCRF